MIRSVSFDLWETLITDTPELSRQQERARLQRMEEILAEHGFASAADRIEQAYRELWHRCQELYWANDVDIPCRRQIEHFLEGLGLDAATFGEPALEALEDAYAHAAVDIPPALVDGALDMLSDVTSRGWKVGIISNTGRTPGYALRRILSILEITPFVDTMVFSNEHGACKPQPSIFAELRAGLGVASDEMVFVGDNLYVDVHGAQRFGMRAIHFTPTKRGTAVAPAVDHGLQITPDAVVSDLREIPAVVEAFE